MSKKPVLVVAAVFYQTSQGSEPKVALFRRAAHNSGAGSWEFPGGKVDDGEGETLALQREIVEELGIQIKVEEKIAENTHDYGNKLIHLIVYFVKPLLDWHEIKLQLVDHDAHKWVSKNEIVINELAPADRPFVEEIFQQLRQK